VVKEIEIDLPHPRDQLSTKESPDFLRLRHEVYTLVREQARKQVPVQVPVNATERG
jgi:NitT/TauT family transport system ATP-binding protein